MTTKGPYEIIGYLYQFNGRTYNGFDIKGDIIPLKGVYKVCINEKDPSNSKLLIQDDIETLTHEDSIFIKVVSNLVDEQKNKFEK